VIDLLGVGHCCNLTIILGVSESLP